MGWIVAGASGKDQQKQAIGGSAWIFKIHSYCSKGVNFMNPCHPWIHVSNIDDWPRVFWFRRKMEWPIGGGGVQNLCPAHRGRFALPSTPWGAMIRSRTPRNAPPSVGRRRHPWANPVPYSNPLRFSAPHASRPKAHRKLLRASAPLRENRRFLVFFPIPNLRSALPQRRGGVSGFDFLIAR